MTWSAWSKCPICDKKFTCRGYSNEKQARNQALKLANEHIRTTHSHYWESWQNKQANLFKGLRKIGYTSGFKSRDFSNPVFHLSNNVPMGVASQVGTKSYVGKEETWQCPTCKLKVLRYVVPGLDTEKFSYWGKKKHQCLKCSKCGKYSSYKTLQLHSIYECSGQQNQPNQQAVNQQIQQINQLINLIQQLSQNAPTIIQSINSDPQLTPQQKQQIINNLNSGISNLKTIADDLADKQKKLNDLATKSEQSKPTNWTPWIVGGVIVLGLMIIVLFAYLLKKKESKKIYK